MGSLRTLSTNSSYEVWLSPGWNDRTGPAYVDMGDGIVASLMTCSASIIDSTTGNYLQDPLQMGRRLVAFRMSADCEVQEIGPPTVVPDDIQAYLDPDTNTEYWDWDYGPDPDEWFSGYDGVDDTGAIVNMGNDIVFAAGLNGLNPQFPNGGDDVESKYYATWDGYQCVGWVARLNRTDLTWEVGQRGTIAGHYWPDGRGPSFVFYQYQRIQVGESSVMGAVKMTDTLAVVSMAMEEYGLAGEHVEFDGTGDYTDEGYAWDLEGAVADITDVECGYLRLCSVRIDPDNLTFQRVDSARVTDRVASGAWFARCDQPVRLSDTRGVIIFSRPDSEGWATVWHHDGAGAFSSFNTTQWIEPLLLNVSYSGNTPEVQFRENSVRTSEFFYQSRNMYDQYAHVGYYYGSCTQVFNNLLAVMGSNTDYYHQFMVLLEVTDADAISITDYKPMPGYRYGGIVALKDGWIWGSFVDNRPQVRPSTPDGYTIDIGYPDFINTDRPRMFLVQADTTSKTLVDYAPLGVGIDHFPFKDAANTREWVGGRGMTSHDYDRYVRYGDDHVVLGGLNGIALISPLTQSFPISYQVDRPQTTASGEDLGFSDSTPYQDFSGVSQVSSETRIGVYPETGPSTTR
jgi:hypothetical protein